jgi:hypothetical protein
MHETRMSQNGTTALKGAVYWGHVDAALALIEAGADPHRRTGVRNHIHPHAIIHEFDTLQFAVPLVTISAIRCICM